MAGTNLINSNIVTKELIFLYDNMPAISKHADWSYSSKFGKTEQIGTSISVRRPVQIQAINDGTWAYSAQSVQDTQVVLALTSPIKYTPFFQDADWGFRVEDFKKRYARSWIRSIVNQVDTLIADLISNAGANITVSSVLGGNPGVVPGQSSVPLTLTGPNWCIYGSGNGATVNGQTVPKYALLASDITLANQILTDAGIPFEDRVGVLTPKAEGQLLSQQATIFTNYKASAGSTDEGKYVEAFGVKFFASPNLANHTTGTAWTSATSLSAVTGQLSSGWAETATLTLAGLTSGQTINIGDVFTVGTSAPSNKIAGSNASVVELQTGDVAAVNPLNRKAMSNRQQFTVVGLPAYTVTAGSATLSATTAQVVVSPAPIYGGDFMNITRALTTSDKASVFDSSANHTGGETFKESVIMYSKAIAIASPELPDYREMGANTRYERDPDTGFGIRTSMTFDSLGVAPGATGSVGVAIRLDLLIGAKLLRPEGVVRIRS